jgi:hypothetical protein
MTTPDVEATFQSELKFMVRRATNAVMGDAIIILLMLITLIL